MQQVLFNTEDLHFALNQVQSRDLIFAAVLAGMLNNWLQRSPMQLVHHRRHNGLEYTYNIARFDIAEEELDEFTRRPPHLQLTAVIDEPTLHFETHPVMQHINTNGHGVAMTLTNVGYKAPPPEEPKKGEEEPKPSGVRGYGGWENICFHDDTFAMLVQHQIALMETWGVAFKGNIKTTKHFNPGQLVIWGDEAQPERFPNIPMFEVVAQVQPFINRDRNGCSEGLVDTIIQPQGSGRGFGSSKEVYAHSTDLLTLDEYQTLLLRVSNRHSAYGGGGIKPSDFIIEVLKGIHESFLKRR